MSEEDGGAVEGGVGDRIERAIEHGEHESPSGPSIRRRIVWLAITAVSLYLVAPSLMQVLGEAGQIGRLEPGWLVAMAALQVLATICLWEVQRLALNTRRWRPVIASQLAGNALTKIAPGGGAVGAALQYRMLVDAGLPRARSVAGLTAANLLIFGVVFALPVLALPAIVRGGVNRSLVEATVIGLVVFAVLLGAAAAALATDAPLRGLGRAVDRVRRRGTTGLAERLIGERDRILATLGSRWKRALLATGGRWAFDYGSLLAALAAVGSQPRPALVLLAFCAAQLLTLVPITPGGVGFVEAGLTATLALAGVSAGNAALATLAYRLYTYWLPLPLGAVGLALHRRWTGRSGYPASG